MSDISAWLKQLDFSWLISTAVTVASALLCITFHELCHGFAAWKLGDPTAKNSGRLTLNPLKHVDILGLIMMAALKFGWAKPVPVDMRHFKNPRRDMAITAAAGPLSNVLLAFLAYGLNFGMVFFLGADGVLSYVSLFLRYTAVLSAGLAVFNLIPIPPLDGSKILLALLPDTAYRKFLRYEKYGMILLCVLLMSNLLDLPLAFLRDGLLNLLHKAALFPYQLIFSLL